MELSAHFSIFILTSDVDKAASVSFLMHVYLLHITYHYLIIKLTAVCTKIIFNPAT